MSTAVTCVHIVVAGDDVFEDLFTAADQLRAIAAETRMAADVACGLDRLLLAERPPDVASLLLAGGEFTPDRQRRLATLVERGMGLLALHSTAVLPEPVTTVGRTAFELFGVRYLSHGPAPHQSRFTVQTDRCHPIAAGTAPFDITAEHYRLALADPPSHVVAWRAAPPVCEHAPKPLPAVRGGWSSIEPLLTVRRHGYGRVAYLQFGHDMRAFGHPDVRRLISNSLLWCAEANPKAGRP